MDHVAEASVRVQSGRVVVAGCTDYWPDAARIRVSPGTYAVRVHYRGLGSPTEDGLAGEDHYRVVLWPGASREPTVLKRRTA